MCRVIFSVSANTPRSIWYRSHLGKAPENALVETIVALALDDLEKDRTSSIATKSTGRSNLIENGETGGERVRHFSI